MRFLKVYNPGKRRGAALFAACAGLCAAALPVAPAAAQTLRLSSGAEYTRGLYGSLLSTEIFIASASARYTDGPWALGVTVPYVHVTGPGVPFDPFSVSLFALRLPEDVDERVFPLLSQPDTAAAYMYPQFRLTTEGLGDVSVSASRSFELRRERLYLDTTATVKLPTGDPDKLIGTGKTDLTLRGDLVYEARGVGLFAGGGRVFTGKTERFALQDRWQASAGLYKPLGRAVTIGALYDWREPLVARSGDISEITTYVSAQIAPRFNVLAYTVAGLSEASPDFGVGLRFAMDFERYDPRGRR